MSTIINFITILAIILGIVNGLVLFIKTKAIMEDPQMVVNQRLGLTSPDYLLRPIFNMTVCLSWIIARFFFN